MDISFAPYLQIQHPVKRVYLWGMMGVGKSNYGKKIAHNLGWKWIDLDELIESEEEKSIATIFKDQGEQAFREMEQRCLTSTADQEQVIISTGGGAPHFNGLADWMHERGMCIWLDAPAGALVRRIEESKTERPLLGNLKGGELESYLTELIAERSASYGKAHLIVNVLQMKPKALADQLKAIIEGKS